MTPRGSHLPPWPAFRLRPSTFKVLAYLASCRNEQTGDTFPAIPKMARETRQNKDTVKAAIKELRTYKVVRTKKPMGLSLRFFFNPPDQWDIPDRIPPRPKKRKRRKSGNGDSLDFQGVGGKFRQKVGGNFQPVTRRSVRDEANETNFIGAPDLCGMEISTEGKIPAAPGGDSATGGYAPLMDQDGEDQFDELPDFGTDNPVDDPPFEEGDEHEDQDDQLQRQYDGIEIGVSDAIQPLDKSELFG